MAALAAAQAVCPDTSKTAALPSLQVGRVVISGCQLLCDVSTGQPRPLVPPSFRRRVFNALHSLSHPGARATRRLISTRFVWPRLASDCTAWCRDCQPCQRSKVTQQYKAPVQPIAVPGRRFAHVHADLVGPLPVSSEGHSHVLTIIDRATRWVEAVPLTSTTAAAVCDAFIAAWVSRYGVPEILTTDRGVQFTSALWQAAMQRLGIQHRFTAAYHPQANGVVERFHRQLKDSLRARLTSLDWHSHLPWVLLGLRAAPKADSAISSAELLFGAPLSLPGQLLAVPEPPPLQFVQELRSTIAGLPTRPLADSPASPLPTALAGATLVYIRRGGAQPPLAPAYSGPFTVVQRGPKVFAVKIGNRVEAVTVDRLKPHLGPSEAMPAAPPLRGRPRGSVCPPGGQTGRG